MQKHTGIAQLQDKQKQKKQGRLSARTDLNTLTKQSKTWRKTKSISVPNLHANNTII